MKAFAIFVIICGIASSVSVGDDTGECDKVPASIGKAKTCCQFPFQYLSDSDLLLCQDECPSIHDNCCGYKCLDKVRGLLDEKIDKELLLKSFQNPPTNAKFFEPWNATVSEGIDKCVTECKCEIIDKDQLINLLSQSSTN